MKLFFLYGWEQRSMGGRHQGKIHTTKLGEYSWMESEVYGSLFKPAPLYGKTGSGRTLSFNRDPNNPFSISLLLWLVLQTFSSLLSPTESCSRITHSPPESMLYLKTTILQPGRWFKQGRDVGWDMGTEEWKGCKPQRDWYAEQERRHGDIHGEAGTEVMASRQYQSQSG